MGHSNCGAVKAACDNFEEGNILRKLLSLLQPAVSEETTIHDPDRNSKNSEFVSNVCFLNVKKQIQNIINQSDIHQRSYYIKNKLASLELFISLCFRSC